MSTTTPPAEIPPIDLGHLSDRARAYLLGLEQQMKRIRVERDQARQQATEATDYQLSKARWEGYLDGASEAWREAREAVARLGLPGLPGTIPNRPHDLLRLPVGTVLRSVTEKGTPLVCERFEDSGEEGVWGFTGEEAEYDAETLADSTANLIDTWTVLYRPEGAAVSSAPLGAVLDLEAGEVVLHATFGMGTVLRVLPKGIVDVDFGTGGSKRLNLRNAPMERLHPR